MPVRDQESDKPYSQEEHEKLLDINFRGDTLDAGCDQGQQRGFALRRGTDGILDPLLDQRRAAEEKQN